MRFSVINLGCKVNRVESDAVCALLLNQGAIPAEPSNADLVIVNTCTVTGEAEKKTRKAVRHALRESVEAPVIVTGCAVAIHPETFEAMSPRVRCVSKAELETAALEAMADLRNAQPMPHDRGSQLLRVGGSFPTRVGVKVQDGCNNACTYCIVHVARGKATSRPAADIIDECVSYARAGVKEIVLTGINLGSYAYRHDGGPMLRLADLLEELISATAAFHAQGEMPCRFRISSVEPRDIDDDLIDMMARAEGRICRHLHLPLQAGSSKVLHEMARPYDAEFFCDLVDRIRARVPELSLSTDIIAGFPGESEEEFAETLQVARYCAFSKIHAFPYSVREGTPAAGRCDQVPADVKTDRASRLRTLGDCLRKEDFLRRVGSRELVLVEQGGRGMTESYYEVPVPGGLIEGSLVPLKLEECLTEA